MLKRHSNICQFDTCNNRLAGRQKKFCCKDHCDRYRYLKEREKRLKYRREYYNKNREEIKKKQRKRFKKWYKKNKEKVLKKQREYNKKKWMERKDGL